MRATPERSDGEWKRDCNAHASGRWVTKCSKSPVDDALKGEGVKQDNPSPRTDRQNERARERERNHPDEAINRGSR